MLLPHRRLNASLLVTFLVHLSALAAAAQTLTPTRAGVPAQGPFGLSAPDHPTDADTNPCGVVTVLPPTLSPDAPAVAGVARPLVPSLEPSRRANHPPVTCSPVAPTSCHRAA